MKVYYHRGTGLPVMQNERPMILCWDQNGGTGWLAQFDKINQLSNWGYTLEEILHTTAEQQTAKDNPDYFIEDFSHKPWHIAKQNGASNMAATVASLGSQDNVLRALQLVNEAIQSEVLNRIYNPEVPEFEEVRKKTSSYCNPEFYRIKLQESATSTSGFTTSFQLALDLIAARTNKDEPLAPRSPLSATSDTNNKPGI